MQGLPRARGGVSKDEAVKVKPVPSSPRTRGCFSVYSQLAYQSLVFPAHAGVFLSMCKGRLVGRRLPRARGGVSAQRIRCSSSALSSPRTRGCFYRRVTFEGFPGVFPAHAGVFPPPRSSGTTATGLPRARGGVSSTSEPVNTKEVSSPRTRGCFSTERYRRTEQKVFPAHAGVFPSHW